MVKKRAKRKKTAGRGRTAGFYFPRLEKVAAVKELNENVNTVFGQILRRKDHGGITQKQIVDRSEIPNSTVWSALVKLRLINAVDFRQPKPKRAKAIKVAARPVVQAKGKTIIPKKALKIAAQIAQLSQNFIAAVQPAA